jgi:hypothetical protein
MNKISLDQKIKLRAIRKGLSMSKIAKNLKTDSGVTISKQRFCDMIKGRRPNDFERFKSQIANILELQEL